MVESDRIVEAEIDNVPEIPEVLEHVLVAALNEAKKKLEHKEIVVPFTALAVKKNLFIETQPGDNVEECFNFARHTVQNASGADCYALCYDGFIDTDAGQVDALIAEGGVPGDDQGYAVGYLYDMPEDEDSDEAPKIISDPVYIGPAPNFMMFTNTEPFHAEKDAGEGEEAADSGQIEAVEAAEAVEDADDADEEEISAGETKGRTAGSQASAK